MRKTLMTAAAGLVGGTAAWAVSTATAVADDFDDDYEVSGPVGWAPWSAYEYDRPRPAPVATTPAEPVATTPAEPVDTDTGMAAEAETEVDADAKADKLALIHFEFDKAEVEDMNESDLQAAKKWIDDHPNGFLVIEGHTDQVGTEAYNAGLATRRAENVRSEILELGADPDRLVVGVYGEQDPVSIEDAENRRVLVRGTSDSLEEISQAELDRGLAVVWAYEPSAEAVAEREEKEPENRNREL
jgi:outer membrane protein OmpA-like peptidoglycan-associated protein